MIDKDQVAQKGIKILDSKDSNPLEEMLKTHFPQSIREGQVNLNAIAALLGKDISNLQGYELTFTGKGLANALYTTPCQKVLKHKETFCHSKTSSCHSEEARATEESPKEIFRFTQNDKKDTNSCHSEPALAGEESSNLGNTNQNTLIIGDNLDALKILKSAYSEKIKMIYIDPPYNTKNDNFIYPDDFRADYKAILREVGLLEIDENGDEVESETLQFFRNITGSKSHSGWLCFILPRLKLARDLLREDGVIFISIDDNEQANLKLLCDEIFGEENFVCCFVWQKKNSGGQHANFILDFHEYILCYAKNIENLTPLLMQRTDKQKESFTLKDEFLESKGKHLLSPLKSWLDYRATLIYDIECPDGSFVNTQWVCAKDTFLNLKQEGRIVFKQNKNGEWSVYKKQYEKENGGLVKPPSIFLDCGNSAQGTREIKGLFNGLEIFTNPKPVSLIKRILEVSTSTDSNDLILDFFAGSGTTAQAVMELNVEDKGNRECILVQLDEPINQEKSKTAYDFCKNELGSENPTISDITIERVKRAAKKINANICLNIFTL